MLDYMQDIRDRPVWQPAPERVRESFREPLPAHGTALGELHARFMQDILPYAASNAHPGFMGWVQGGGTPIGMLADMLAAGLNANLGGRDHVPIDVERQVVRWVRELFGFPESASGLFVTGSSMGNMIAVLVARTAALGRSVREDGLTATNAIDGAAEGRALVAYTSAAAHGCIAQAMDLAGFGTNALRIVPTNDRHEMDVAALGQAITADRAAGLVPFFIAATAGTVDVGAIDDLAAIAELARRDGIWFHVDGALGALGVLAPEIAPRLAGIELADSIAFDFHKWGQVPYEAGFILVRDGDLHRSTFASAVSYLRREPRGLAGGSPWPCDYGPDLSRGFKALKTWFTIKAYGTERLGNAIAQTCELARYMQQQIEQDPALELLAPVALNVVCFRYRTGGADVDQINSDIVADLQHAGIVAPSTTTIGQSTSIRAAIVNHRTDRRDIDALLVATVARGDAYTGVARHRRLA